MQVSGMEPGPPAGGAGDSQDSKAWSRSESSMGEGFRRLRRTKFYYPATDKTRLTACLWDASSTPKQSQPRCRDSEQPASLVHRAPGPSVPSEGSKGVSRPVLEEKIMCAYGAIHECWRRFTSKKDSFGYCASASLAVMPSQFRVMFVKLGCMSPGQPVRGATLGVINHSAPGPEAIRGVMLGDPGQLLVPLSRVPDSAAARGRVITAIISAWSEWYAGCSDGE